MSKHNRSWIVGLLCICNISAAQNVYHNPDSLLQQGDYKNAIIGFERKIYFANTFPANDTSSLNELYTKMSLCYKNMAQYDKAYLTLSHTDTSYQKNKDVQYQKVLLSYLANDFATTELEYNEHNMSLENDARLNTLYLLSLHELGKWKDAKMLFDSKALSLPIHVDSSHRLLLYTLYSKPPKFKKASTAEALNTFIPGGGYLYLGKRKDGLTLMGLQLLSLGITGGLVYNKLYFTGGAIGLGLFEKFRRGSINRALIMTEDVNNIKKFTYNQKLKKALLE